MTMAERIKVHNGIEAHNDRAFGRMAVMQRMERFIKEAYPDAVMEFFIDTKYGTEYTFLPHPGADEPYSCIVNSYGAFTILTEF